MASVTPISLALRLRLLIIVPLLLFIFTSQAQVCSDPTNVVYGLTNSGLIHPINVNTGVAGTAINPAYPGNAPDQSNGLAYNGVNGNFYYFKRIPSSSIIEFVSFNPSTNTYTILSSPATTNSVYSGSITGDGTGYYCWDTQGRLFYYRFSTNTWTTITSSIVDQYGKDVDSIIRAHSSGDGAIDGFGNLWILPSSDTRYGLFRTNGALPTTPVASLTVQQIVAMTPPPSKFVGIAFTVTGEIFMCTSNSRIYRLEDNLTLTHMSTMTVNMGDLTSCNFPLAVLASDDVAFTALVVDESVRLSWKPFPAAGSFSYVVERSTDNTSWKSIASGNELSFGVNDISYFDRQPLNGRNFYRIRIVHSTNVSTYSVIKAADLRKAKLFSIWPNPVTTDLYIFSGAGAASIVVYDQAGNKIKSTRTTGSVDKINFSPLPSGRYFLLIRNSDGTQSSHKIIKK